MRRNLGPLVKMDSLIVADRDGAPDHLIQVGSPAWQDWLATHHKFTYEGAAGHLTARREFRRGIGYWYAYRRRDGKLTKTYLGKACELTRQSLEHASALLAGQNQADQELGDDQHHVSISNAIIPAPKQTPFSRHPADIPYLNLTKVKSPVLPERLVARPRLTQRINVPLTLISAPSGFGKTTLVNEWKQLCAMPVAWVALDATDNQPQRFWSLVVMALQAIDPSIGQGWLSKLRTSSPSPQLNPAINLVNDIVRATDKPNMPGICLVLDDFHHIQRPELHSAVQTWLEQIPSKFQLIITSNFKLPLVMGYLRSKGMVAELSSDDLRFTLEEGIDFLKKHNPGQPLGYNEMQTLVKRTEGWVAGLVLAISVLSQQENRTHVMEIFTGAHVFLREFFMEGVLRQQCADVKDFLLRTSILEHLTGSLCDTITGRGDGDEMLVRLWEESLFLERLEKPGWYRYHEMFAEMLRTQLQEQSPLEIPRLHRKAAKWYRVHGSPAEAIHHLLLSKSWEDAAALLEQVALSELEQSGEASRLLRWLQQLPESVVQQHQTLLGVYIRLAQLVLPVKEVDDFLARTKLRISSTPPSEKTDKLLQTLSEIRRTRHAWATGNPARLGYQPNREPDAAVRLLDGILQYHRQSRFDLVKAESRANEVYTAASASGHLYSMLMAGGACATLAYSQGNLRRSEQMAQRVLQQSVALRDRLPEPASIALIALSGVYFERNQLAPANQLLDRAIEVDPQPIRPDEFINMAIQRAKIQSIQGDTETAFDTIQAIREANSQHPSSLWLDQDLIAYQALFRLSQGDISAADRHLSGGWEVDQHPFSAFIRASILVEQNRNVAAEEILRHLLEHYPHGFYWVPTLRARVKLATALFRQKKVNQACQVMAEAARLAAPEFFVRPFLVPDPEFPLLLSLVLHTENLNPGTRTFLKGTLATLGYADDAEDKFERNEPAPLAVAASISPREQEILHSLSVGLSNQEIATQYSISISTVKTHLENIYRKLGVSNRMQAIAKAQALRLV